MSGSLSPPVIQTGFVQRSLAGATDPRDPERGVGDHGDNAYGLHRDRCGQRELHTLVF
jgi:hypothetical protein